MAREDDDDDASLPPIGEGTADFLAEAKKGKLRNFLLIAKGNKVKYLLVSKKPIKKAKITEAKKLGYKGESFIGVITGSGQQLVFNLAIADGYESEPCKEKSLKDFLDEHADFKCLPSFAIVATPPEVPFDEEDLNHPVVARFLKLTELVYEVLDKRPESSTEVQSSANEIRQLLQEGLFQDAEPRITSFETRLRQLLAVEQGPTQSSATTDNSDAALKLKLLDALNKLVPQLKQAVTNHPDKKVELLTPVAQIKNQLDSGALQEAKVGIIAVGQLLKSVLSQPTASKANESPARSVDELRDEYERKLAELQPNYDRALKEMLGDTSKFKTVMAYLREQAGAGVYGNAIKALDRLSQAIATAIAAGKKETDVIPENVVRDRQKFLTSRWQEIVRESHLEVDKLLVPISQVPGENPQELVAAIRQNLDDFLDDLNDAILGSGSASSENDSPIKAAIKAIQSYRTKIQSDPVLSQLERAKRSFNVDLKVSEKLLSGLSELESRLSQ